MIPPIIRTENGLDVPISGAPKQEIGDGPRISRVAVLGDDFRGMKPTMLVREGDSVKLGQPLFEDKKTPGVLHVSPGTGVVQAVVRGAKRHFEAIIIELAESESGQYEAFKKHEDEYLAALPREEVRDTLVRSGLWPALRTRPYGKTPTLESSPHAIFVTVTDTNPLAAEPAVVMQEPDHERFFQHGVLALTTQADGDVFLCRAPAKQLPAIAHERVHTVAFDGPHPSGLAGTHIHFLSPVNGERTVWHIGYQDVVAIGRLLLTGKLCPTRVVSLAGPAIKKPRLIRTRLGASIDDLTDGEFAEAESDRGESSDSEAAADGADRRVLSGAVLAGRQCTEQLAFLSRFDTQVTVLMEGREREFLGWATPGADKFSVSRAFISAFTGRAKPAAMTTKTHGDVRAIVPIGLYEKVMPLDIIATPLLKALMVQDNETTRNLGCLELEEEDLALCTFVCPSKNEYGPLLRQSLNHIELEG